MDREYAAQHREYAKEKTRAWAAANPERKKAADKAYALANSEKLRERSREWKSANPEKVQASAGRYQAKHGPQLLARRAEVYARNAESARAAARAWAKANPDKRRAQHASRKAQKIQAQPAWADISAMEQHYRYARHLTEATGILHHVDHIVPLRSKYVCGLHCEANLQVLPAVENMKKRNRFVPGVDG